MMEEDVKTTATQKVKLLENKRYKMCSLKMLKEIIVTSCWAVPYRLTTNSYLLTENVKRNSCFSSLSCTQLRLTLNIMHGGTSVITEV